MMEPKAEPGHALLIALFFVTAVIGLGYLLSVASVAIWGPS